MFIFDVIEATIKLVMEHEITVSDDSIGSKIFVIRHQKVMLDKDLAALYQVDTKQLKRQVRRNIERFPEDFMFELTQGEYEILRSQFGTLKRGEHSKYLPWHLPNKVLPCCRVC
jgi:hypothetical protein